jgi:hypothetical protein
MIIRAVDGGSIVLGPLNIEGDTVVRGGNKNYIGLPNSRWMTRKIYLCLMQVI